MAVQIIKVSTLSKEHNINIYVDENYTFHDIKQDVEQELNLPIKYKKIIFKEYNDGNPNYIGREYKDNEFIKSLNISNNSTFTLLVTDEYKQLVFDILNERHNILRGS